MVRTGKSTDIINNFLCDRKIATLRQLKRALSTQATMTVFRALRRLGYYTSYSHRGGYYTLKSIPEFDEWGLWSFQSVYFSRFGNLLATAEAFVESSEAGYSAAELDNALGVETKHTLLKLTRCEKIQRDWSNRGYVYYGADPGKKRQQVLMREDRQVRIEMDMSPNTEFLPEEVKAAIILFFSMLDEKQRRLYAGLEAAKLGHGGDRSIAQALGIDVHTVAKGRRELLDRSVERKGVRSDGAGRQCLEKKRRK